MDLPQNNLFVKIKQKRNNLFTEKEKTLGKFYDLTCDDHYNVQNQC